MDYIMCVLYAATGRGKTVNFIQQFAAVSPDAVIIFDPKGDDYVPQPKDRAADDRPEGEVDR